MYDKEKYERNKHLHRKSWTKRQNRNRDFVTEYKLSAGCKLCGFNSHPAALHLHHLSDKIHNVSRLVSQGASLDRVKEEVYKCEVLCANCHAILHNSDMV